MSTLFWGCDEQADSPALGHLCSEKQKQAYSCAHIQLSSSVLLLPCFWESLWLVCVATGACCSCVCHLNCQWHWRKPILKSLCYIILLTSGQQLFFPVSVATRTYCILNVYCSRFWCWEMKICIFNFVFCWKGGKCWFFFFSFSFFSLQFSKLNRHSSCILYIHMDLICSFWTSLDAGVLILLQYRELMWNLCCKERVQFHITSVKRCLACLGATLVYWVPRQQN